MTDTAISHQHGPFSMVTMSLPGDHEGTTSVRVFIVRGRDKIALIDTGLLAGLPVLLRGLAELGLDPSAIDHLLLTHEHMDHIGNSGWLKAHSKLEILGSPVRADRVADNQLNAKAIVHAFPEGEHYDLVTEYLEQMGPVEGPIDSFIGEGDVLDLGGGVTLETIELPGHSLAEIGFFESSTKTLVVADALLPPFNPVLYLYEDPVVMRATFDKIERLLVERDVQKVLLAHVDPMGPVEAQDLIRNCRQRVEQVEKSIVQRIGEKPGVGFAELRDAACDDQGMVREWRALVSVDASLKHLAAAGAIEKRGDGWYPA